MAEQRRHRWYALFFLSGVCGIGYQVVWARLLTQIIGSTVYAVSLVTALFMAGLAVGSLLGGRIADRAAAPFSVYGIVELCTALFAALSFLAVPALERLFAAAAGGVRSALTVLAPLATVLPATTLLGMGMPLLARPLAHTVRTAGADAGRLYVINTAGALAGAVLAAFVLIAQAGVTGTWVLAVGLNAAVGAVALVLARRGVPVEPAPTGTVSGAPGGERAAAAPDRLTVARPVLIGLFVLSGFLSLGYEVFWTRSLVTILGNSTYAFAATLIVTLLGLVCGSALTTRRVDAISRPLRTLGILEAGIGISSLVVLPLLLRLLYTSGLQSFFFAERAGWFWSLGLRFLVAAAVLLIPSLLNGATLPLMLRVLITDRDRRARQLGTAYAADTGGNVLGALVPAFLILPAAGIARGLLLLAVANVALGLFYLMRPRLRAAVLPLGVAAVIAVLFVPVTFRFPSDSYSPGDPVLFYREGVEATTAVYRKQDTGAWHMSVDGVFIGGSGDAARKELVLAHLHPSIHPEARTVLTVGLGSGVLAAELAGYEHFTQIDVVEIAPSVAAGAQEIPDWNAVYPADSRVSLAVEDVMTHLLGSPTTYDLIISDGKSRPTARGNGLFFSLDYYRRLQTRLADDGVVLQWLSLQLAEEDVRTILRTFSQAFAHTALFWLPDTDAFLIGSQRPIAVAAPAGSPARPTPALAPYGILTAGDAAPLVVASGSTLSAIAGAGPVNTLDRPVIEFYDPRDYAGPPAAVIAQNLQRLAAVPGEAQPLLRVLAAAYAGTPVAEADAAAAAITSGVPAVDAAVARYYVVRASSRLREGAFAAAADYAALARARHPGSYADASYYEGLARAQAGDAEAGERLLREAVGLAPRVPIYRITLARLLLATGRTEPAIEQYQAVLRVMPQNVSALQSVGVYRASQGDPEAGLELLGEAYAIAPHEPSVIDSYAWLLFQQGRVREARRVVRGGGDYAAGREDVQARRQAILEGS